MSNENDFFHPVEPLQLWGRDHFEKFHEALRKHEEDLEESWGEFDFGEGRYEY